MTNMKIETLVLSMVQTNCYIVSNRTTKECFVIDPADSAAQIIDKIEAENYQVKGILLTHGHFDHIGAAESVSKHFGTKIYAAKEERKILEDPAYNLSASFGAGYGINADVYLSDQEKIDMAGFEIQALLTPGHTCGGMCYYIESEGVVFCGDTLFMESVGRTDFPTGHAGVLAESVETKLFTLPENTVAYPGHGSYTSIGYEKINNPFF